MIPPTVSELGEKSNSKPGSPVPPRICQYCFPAMPTQKLVEMPSSNAIPIGVESKRFCDYSKQLAAETSNIVIHTSQPSKVGVCLIRATDPPELSRCQWVLQLWAEWQSRERSCAPSSAARMPEEGYEQPSSLELTADCLAIAHGDLAHGPR